MCVGCEVSQLAAVIGWQYNKEDVRYSEMTVQRSDYGEVFMQYIKGGGI